MGVHKLPHAENQPFYRVLVSDGSERYAAEENLVRNSVFSNICLRLY